MISTKQILKTMGVISQFTDKQLKNALCLSQALFQLFYQFPLSLQLLANPRVGRT